jgi:TolB-like protein
MPVATDESYCFQGYTLDLRRGSLRYGDREVELRPKSFALLRHLVEQAGRLVSKDELIAAVWPNVVVADESLTRCVSEVRAALDDGEQRIIKTLPRRGYLFAAQVSPPVPESSSPPDEPTRLAAPRMSIAVLPFLNLSGDPSQDYFVDGVAEDLMTELARLPGLLVIARTSAFFYKGKNVDVRDIGRELGIRYALEGSVRKADKRMRVAAQLIDAETGTHLWADRFDREITDFFELQDEIVRELASVLRVRVIDTESRRGERSLNPDAFDLVLRAHATLNRGVTRENNGTALALFEQALRVDPQDVAALIGVAAALLDGVSFMWSQTRDDDVQRAATLATRALTVAPHFAWSHFTAGVARRHQGRFEEAADALEMAIRLNPSLHLAHLQFGWTAILLGRAEAATPYFLEFIRVSPRDRFLSFGYMGIGLARLVLGDYAPAIEMLRKSLSLGPSANCQLYLACAYGMQGRITEARAALTLHLESGTSTKTISTLRADAHPGAHPIYLAQRERLLDGLRRAGMPEE